jgi:hypothetical protein
MKFTVKRNEDERISYTSFRNCAIARGLKSKGYVDVMVSPNYWVGRTPKGIVNFGLIPVSENQKAINICIKDREVYRVDITLPRPMRAVPKNIELVKDEIDIHSYNCLLYVLETFGITN